MPIPLANQTYSIREIAPLANAPIPPAAQRARETTLPFFFIGLAARLARCDGAVNAKEIEAFLDTFSKEAYPEGVLKSLFQSACRDRADDVYYARRIANAYPDDTVLYSHMFVNLLHVATADAPLNQKEVAYLKKITAIFHLTDEEVDRALKEYYTPIQSVRIIDILNRVRLWCNIFIPKHWKLW